MIRFLPVDLRAFDLTRCSDLVGKEGGSEWRLGGFEKLLPADELVDHA